MEKTLNKDQETVFGFDEKYIIGFSDILHPEDFGNTVHGYSKLINYFEYVVNKGYFKFRGDAETDPSFKQIIPYVVLRSGEEFLSYERCGNESRLSNKVSIGIGGHVNSCDNLKPSGNMIDIIKRAAIREFDEELSIIDKTHFDSLHVSTFLKRPVGFIYAGNQTEVDSVHFGVIYQVKIDKGLAERIELTDEGKNLSWKTREDLLKEESLETWSRMCLESL